MSDLQEEVLAKLELEFEIQGKITSAALKLANDASAKKSVRKARKNSYQVSHSKVCGLHFYLSSLCA